MISIEYILQNAFGESSGWDYRAFLCSLNTEPNV